MSLVALGLTLGFVLTLFYEIHNNLAIKTKQKHVNLKIKQRPLPYSVTINTHLSKHGLLLPHAVRTPSHKLLY